MKFAVIVFPGSNCDHDAYHVFKNILGVNVNFVWHKENDLKKYDAIIIPGGFSYGDYLRTGAIARFSPVMNEVIKGAKSGKPIFGICLGHQILAILFGGKTEKMHHGHRGANHPIKNLKSGNVEITVQNHGFVVSKKKLPVNINITHKSLFDGTIAGIKIKNKPFFSVQYHPEASPGPQDSRYLFQDFKNLVKKNA